jgi:hypothetical protein
VKKGTVNGAGVLTVDVAPKLHTTYTASFAGDDTHQPSDSKGAVVQVHALATGKEIDFYGTAGQYKLYHYKSTCTRSNLRPCPALLGRVLPVHAGESLTFVAQVNGGGGWHTVATGSFQMGSNGSVIGAFYGGTPGHSYRVQVRFAGDGRNLGDTSPWYYFRITT